MHEHGVIASWPLSTHRYDLESEGDEVAPSECEGHDPDVGVDVGLAAVVQEERVHCGTHQRGRLSLLNRATVVKRSRDLARRVVGWGGAHEVQPNAPAIINSIGLWVPSMSTQQFRLSRWTWLARAFPKDAVHRIKAREIPRLTM